MNKSILVVAAHPDDETLGCGGTLLKHRQSMDKISWLIVTAMTRACGYAENKIMCREKEIEAVTRAYGFSDVFQLGFPAAALDTLSLSSIIQKIREAIIKAKAEVIYLPHAGDLHTDHQITHRAVIASTRSFRTPEVKKILVYETISETEFCVPTKKHNFVPNIFVDVSSLIGKKVAIMRLYKSEIKQSPFPRSSKNIKALATFRGAMAGVRYAESFMLIREFI